MGNIWVLAGWGLLAVFAIGVLVIFGGVFLAARKEKETVNKPSNKKNKLQQVVDKSDPSNSFNFLENKSGNKLVVDTAKVTREQATAAFFESPANQKPLTNQLWKLSPAVEETKKNKAFFGNDDEDEFRLT